MTLDRYDAQPPSWLEDEVLLIETSGEMPEVALAESIAELGGVPAEDLPYLQAAAARGYLALVRRDLDYSLVGLPPFRGLERALCNWGRLTGFLARLGWPVPEATRAEMGALLATYLEEERRALAGGRNYATATVDQVAELARAWGLELEPFRGLLREMSLLPVPDFLALRALGKLAKDQAKAKRRREKAGRAVLELLDGQGEPLARAVLPLMGPADCEAPENRARLELIWRLLDLPAA